MCLLERGWNSIPVVKTNEVCRNGGCRRTEYYSTYTPQYLDPAGFYLDMAKCVQASAVEQSIARSSIQSQRKRHLPLELGTQPHACTWRPQRTVHISASGRRG